MARIKYREAVGVEVKKGKPALGRKPNKSELKKLYEPLPGIWTSE